MVDEMEILYVEKNTWSSRGLTTELGRSNKDRQPVNVYYSKGRRVFHTNMKTQPLRRYHPIFFLKKKLYVTVGVFFVCVCEKRFDHSKEFSWGTEYLKEIFLLGKIFMSLYDFLCLKKKWELVSRGAWLLSLESEEGFHRKIHSTARASLSHQDDHLPGTRLCQTNVPLLFWHFSKNLIETIYVQITLSRVALLHLFQDIFGNKRDDLGLSCFSNLGLLPGSTERFSPTLQIHRVGKHSCSSVLYVSPGMEDISPSNMFCL